MPNQFFEIVENAAGEQEMHCHAHRYQQATLDCQAQETYNLKGWRGGFTSPTPFWLMNEMIRSGPGGLAVAYLCITPTLQVARGGIMPEMERVFCNYLQFGKMYQAPRQRIEINERGEQALWGHRQRERTSIVFCYAADPDSFASYTGLAAVGDEVGQKAFKIESKNVLDARLSTALGQKSKIDGRPLGRQLHGSTVYTWGWVKRQYDEWIRKVMEMWHALPPAEFRRRFWNGTLHPQFHFFRYDSKRNPLITADFLSSRRAALPNWFYQMRYRARFTRPAGLIMEGWNPARHLVAPFKLSPKWPRNACVDFGPRNFYASLIAHDEKRDRHFLYKSYHRSDLNYAQHAEQILAVERDIAFAVAGQISEEKQRAELASGGLASVPPMFKDLWHGINTFNAALRLDKFYIFRDEADDSLPEGWCIGNPGLVQELESYSRPIDESTGLVKMDEDPENKETYHNLDKIRYYSTHKFNVLMRDATALRAAPSEPERPTAAIRAAGPDQARSPALLRAGGGMTRYGRARMHRYGLDAGCTEPHLDIDVR